MKRLLTLAGVAALVLAPTQANAQRSVFFGPQLNWGDDADFGIGGRVLVDIPGRFPLSIIGSFDYFFPDEDVAGVDLTYWEINGNLVYNFAIASAPTFTPYAGTGLNIAYFSTDVQTTVGQVGDSETDLGLNFLGGGRVQVGSIAPFFELRIEAWGGEQFVITGGVLF